MSEARLRSIMTSMKLTLVVEPSVDEFFLIDSENRSYASGKTIEELLQSWDDHGGYTDLFPKEI